jgi:hypothetical protein
MGYLEQLPEPVAELIRTAATSHYATVSQAGVPIDTPLMLFPSADLATLDLATGLAYPTKAERARRNPKVGLLIEGGPNRPVISIAGMAAVRDSDLQANLERYLAETYSLPLGAMDQDWDTVIRHAVWYYSRILISVTPAHIRWWDTPGAMDGPPQEWRAPASASYPLSDPAPSGKPSEPAPWPQRTWQEVAAQALGRGAAGHLTLLDADGFPLPIGARSIALTESGFELDVPRGAPWTAGKATLSFGGLEMLVGDVTREGDATLMRVERALPLFPLAEDTSEILKPKPDTRAALLARLQHEAARRGQPIPTMPETPPAPTAGARRRAAAMAR